MGIFSSCLGAFYTNLYEGLHVALLGGGDGGLREAKLAHQRPQLARVEGHAEHGHSLTRRINILLGILSPIITKRKKLQNFIYLLNQNIVIC